MIREIYRDQWGIPHLRGDSFLALAFAQGHNAATDRPCQLAFERRRALGATAAVLGPAELGWDRFARQALLADTARRCSAALDPDTAAWVAAYTDGVRAGGVEPFEPWAPLAIWLSHHILFAGFPAKLWRTEVTARLGPSAVDWFAADGPYTSGSNGWLIPGSHTATGSPLIAGDPHRFIEDPGIYQQIHLSCPGVDVAGFAVPGVPGIPHFGHSGTVAWAITNAMADYQDLYRERLRRTPAGVQALGPDGWEPAAAHVETVDVAGAAPAELEVIETARGSLILGGPGAAATEGMGISLRYPPRVRAELGFAALPALLRAHTVADVDAEFERWAEPVNVVLAADTSGGLLHRVAGWVPDRSPENRGRRAGPRPVAAVAARRPRPRHHRMERAVGGVLRGDRRGVRRRADQAGAPQGRHRPHPRLGHPGAGEVLGHAR